MADDFVFHPPDSGSWSVLDRVAANHEAAHALIAALLDVEIFEVRIDRPIDKYDARGWIQRAHVPSAGASLAITIAPLVFDKRAPWLPSLSADDGDEFQAAVIFYDAGMTKADYDKVIREVEGFLGSHDRALTAISGLLLERGAVPGSEIKRIVDEETRVS